MDFTQLGAFIPPAPMAAQPEEQPFDPNEFLAQQFGNMREAEEKEKSWYEDTGLWKGTEKAWPNIKSYWHSAQGQGKFFQASEDIEKLTQVYNAIGEDGIDSEGRLTKAGKDRLAMTSFELAGNPISQRLLSGEDPAKVRDELLDKAQKKLDEAQNDLYKGFLEKPEQSDAIRSLTATEGTITVDEFLNVATSAEAMVDLFTESLIPSVLIAGSAFGGGVAGARGGAVGATMGAAIAAGFASFNVEQKASFLQYMSEYDVDLFNVREFNEFVANNPDKVKDAMHRANMRGYGIGTLDAISAGTGGALLRSFMLNVEKKALTGTAINMPKFLLGAGGVAAAEVGLQSIEGGLGEAAGQYLAGDEFDPDAVAQEVLGEFGPGGVGEVVGGYKTKRMGDTLNEIAQYAQELNDEAVEDVISVVEEVTATQEEQGVEEWLNETEEEFDSVEPEPIVEEPAPVATAEEAPVPEIDPDTASQEELEAADVAMDAEESRNKYLDDEATINEKAKKLLDSADRVATEEAALAEELNTPLRPVDETEEEGLPAEPHVIMTRQAVANEEQEKQGKVDLAKINIGLEAVSKKRSMYRIESIDEEGTMTLRKWEVLENGERGSGYTEFKYNRATGVAERTSVADKTSGRATESKRESIPAYVKKIIDGISDKNAGRKKKRSINPKTLKDKSEVAISHEEYVETEVEAAKKSENALIVAQNKAALAEHNLAKARARLFKGFGDQKRGTARNKELRRAVEAYHKAKRAQAEAAVELRIRKELWVKPSEAMKKAQAKQRNTIELYKKATGLKFGPEFEGGPALAEGYTAVEVKDKVPVREGEEKSGVVTLASEEELAALESSEINRASFIQVTADGKFRVVAITPSRQGNTYQAHIVEEHGRKLKKPVYLGSTTIALDRAKLEKITEDELQAAEQEKANEMNRMKSTTGQKRGTARQWAVYSKPGRKGRLFKQIIKEVDQDTGQLQEKKVGKPTTGKKGETSTVDLTGTAEQLAAVEQEYDDLVAERAAINRTIRQLEDKMADIDPNAEETEIDTDTLDEEATPKRTAPPEAALTPEEDQLYNDAVADLQAVGAEIADAGQVIRALKRRLGAEGRKGEGSGTADQTRLARYKPEDPDAKEEFFPLEELDFFQPEETRRARAYEAARAEQREEEEQAAAIDQRKLEAARLKALDKELQEQEAKQRKEDSAAVLGMVESADIEEQARGIARISKMSPLDLQDRYSIPELRRVAKAIGAKKARSRQALADSISVTAGRQFQVNTATAQILEMRQAQNERASREKAEQIAPDVSQEDFPDTPEGRALYQHVYTVELFKRIVDAGFSQTTALQAVEDVLSDLDDPAAARILSTALRNMFSLRKNPSGTGIAQGYRPPSLREEMRRQDEILALQLDRQNKMSVIRAEQDRLLNNDKGLTVKDYRAVEKATAQFARTPDFLEEDVFAEEDGIAAEIRALEEDIGRIESRQTPRQRRMRGRTLSLRDAQAANAYDEAQAEDALLDEMERDEFDEGVLYNQISDVIDIALGYKAATPIPTNRAAGSLTAEQVRNNAKNKEPESVQERLNDPENVVDEEELSTSFFNPDDYIIGEEDDYSDMTDEERELERMEQMEESEEEQQEDDEEAAADKAEKARNNRIKVTQLNNPQAVDALMEPRVLSKTRLARLGRAIKGQFKRTFTSRGTYPRAMEAGRAASLQGKGRVAYALEKMKGFGEKLDLALLEEGILEDRQAHETMNKAIVARIEGMRPQSVKAKYGVTPSARVEALIDEYVPYKRTLEETMRKMDALDPKLKTVIKRNEGMWLRKSFRATPSMIGLFSRKKYTSGDLTDEQRETIKDLAIVAFGLPEDEAGYNNLSEHWLRGLIGEGKAHNPTKTSSGKDYIKTYLLDKNGDIVLKKDGTAKEGLVGVRKATKDQLIYFLQQNTWNDEAIGNFISNIIKDLKRTSVSGPDVRHATTAEGSPGLFKKRSVMLSQRQQIDQMIKLIRKSGTNDQLNQVLKDSREQFLELNREEFIDFLARTDPETRALVQRSEAEYQLWDIVREAFGEITDPGFLMQDSAVRLASEIERRQALQDMVQAGVDAGLLAIDLKSRPEGALEQSLTTRKQLISRSELPILGLDSFRMHITNPQTGRQESVRASSVYGDQHTIEAMQDLMNTRVSMQHGAAMSVVYRMAAMAKYDKVVLNPLAHLRNAGSTFWIGASRGVVGMSMATNPFVAVLTDRGGFMTGMRLARAEATAARPFGSQGRAMAAQQKLERPELESLALEMAKRSVTHDSVHQGAMADLYESIQSMSWDESLALFNSGIAVTAREASASVGRGRMRMSQFANEMFRLEDEAMKGIAFYQRTQQFLMIAGADGGFAGQRKDAGDLLRAYLNPNNALSEAEKTAVERAMDLAAQNVSDTFPTFSKAPAFIKALSRNPVLGAFPTFTAEMIRNHANHAMFGINLLFGKHVDGTQIKGTEARRRAFALGTGLLLQQATWLGMQTAMTGGMNLLMRQGEGRDDADKEALLATAAGVSKETARAMLGAATSPGKAYENYAVRNLMPSWHETSALWTVDVDPVTHTITSINGSWSSPEGAVMEMGYGMYKDILSAVNNAAFSEEFAYSLAMDLTGDMVSRLMGVFGNEEVLWRDFWNYVSERDGLTTENIEGWRKGAGRTINQFIRARLDRSNNIFYEGDPDRGIPLRQVGAAGLTALGMNFPGVTAATQVLDGVTSAWEARDLINDPNKLLTTVAKKAVTTAAGIRLEEFDFIKDYPKTLAFTHSRRLRDVSTKMVESLFDPTREYTEAEFKFAYHAMNNIRRRDFDNITNAIDFGSRRLGVDSQQMTKVFNDSTPSGEFKEIEGHSFEQLKGGQYVPLEELSTARLNTVEEHWNVLRDKGIVPASSLATRLIWLGQAAAEARTGDNKELDYDGI